MRTVFDTGAYRWVNVKNGMVYVGGAYTSFVEREASHRRMMRTKTHYNLRFQRAWHKYGADSFIFEVIQRSPPEDVSAVEQKWLDFYGAGDGKISYNLNSFSDRPPSALGLKRSEETKRKMSESMKGNRNCLGMKHSKQSKKRMSRAAKKRMSDPQFLADSMERLHRPEVYKKISESTKKRYQDPEERIKASLRSKKALDNPVSKGLLSEAALSQWSDPESRKKKIEGMRRREDDPVHREKHNKAIRDWNAKPENYAAVLQRNRSAEHRAKVSAGMMGHRVSEETKRKLSERAKAQWADRSTRKKMEKSLRKAGVRRRKKVRS